jgi:hypothetical protein
MRSPITGHLTGVDFERVLSLTSAITDHRP